MQPVRELQPSPCYRGLLSLSLLCLVKNCALKGPYTKKKHKKNKTLVSEAGAKTTQCVTINHPLSNIVLFDACLQFKLICRQSLCLLNRFDICSAFKNKTGPSVDQSDVSLCNQPQKTGSSR